MTFEEIVQAAFDDELEQIAGALKTAAPGEFRPNTALTTLAPRMSVAKSAPKTAATRSVKEWQRASATGDQSTADQIAQSHGQLGLKPRQLKDISQGGEEAGVDLMMGHASVPSTGEANQSGYLARKLYKPDSSITRGEYTPQLLQQKQIMTDKARAMSPEAKQMVPAMYGHETHGTGPLQRTTSLHEYVPGISDLRGEQGHDPAGRTTYARPRSQAMEDVEKVKNTVLDPMKAQGLPMGDVHRPASEGGPNWGNVVGSKQGPKVLDFLPANQEGSTAQSNTIRKYHPAAIEDVRSQIRAGVAEPKWNSSLITGSRFSGQNAQPVSALRKEVFNPQMRIEPPQTAAPPVSSGVRATGATAPTSVQGIGAKAVAAPPMKPSMPTAAIPLVRPHVPAAPMAAAGGMLQKAEHSVAAKAPGMLGRIGKFFR